MVTKLCFGQEMLYKINQRGIIEKRNQVELRFLCTALRVIARSMHTKFGVIWTYDDKVTLRARKAERPGRRKRHKSNTYMSPFQATQKGENGHKKGKTDESITIY